MRNLRKLLSMFLQ